MGLPMENNFNSDTSKQVPEVIFSRKIKVTAHPQLVFNNNPVPKSILKYFSISN